MLSLKAEALVETTATIYLRVRGLGRVAEPRLMGRRLKEDSLPRGKPKSHAPPPHVHSTSYVLPQLPNSSGSSPSTPRRFLFRCHSRMLHRSSGSESEREGPASEELLAAVAMINELFETRDVLFSVEPSERMRILKERQEACIASLDALEPTQVVSTPYTLHPTTYTLQPYTLHPTPYTLHPTPYTLHPSPYTLYATPYTIHPDKPKSYAPELPPASTRCR